MALIGVKSVPTSAFSRLASIYQQKSARSPLWRLKYRALCRESGALTIGSETVTACSYPSTGPLGIALCTYASQARSCLPYRCQYRIMALNNQALTPLIFPSDLTREGLDARHLNRQQRRGELVRVRHGAYVPRTVWESLDSAEQYGLAVESFVARANNQPVLCHATAALLWGLWLPGNPQYLHILTQNRSRGTNRGDIIRHREQANYSVLTTGSFLLTDKLSTALSLIVSLPFEEAVAVCDSAMAVTAGDPGRNLFLNARSQSSLVPLPRPLWKPGSPQGRAVRREEFIEAIASLPSQAARTRATAVVNFSTALSGSFGESISRVRIDQLGYVAPELQHRFHLHNGQLALVDFWFKDVMVAGEFDGLEKYFRADWGTSANGDPTSPRDRLIAEKRREDAIRAQGVRVVRWTWAELKDLHTFNSILAQCGIPRRPS